MLVNKPWVQFYDSMAQLPISLLFRGKIRLLPVTQRLLKKWHKAVCKLFFVAEKEVGNLMCPNEVSLKTV